MSHTVVKVGLKSDTESVLRLVSADYTCPTVVSIPIEMIEQIEKIMRDFQSVQAYLTKLKMEM